MPAIRSQYLRRGFVPSWHRATREPVSSSFPVNGIWAIGLFLSVLVLAASSAALAQDRDTFTPMPLDRGFGPMNTAAPDIAPEEIIRRFAARETELHEAISHYAWRREVRIQTINDAWHSADGEWYEVDDELVAPDGRRIETTVNAPPSTLRRVILSPSDLEDLQVGYFFVLTTAEVPAYNISYDGKQKVDEVNCYVFDVSPKQIRKDHRYLHGRIWVDDHDYQIVITDGRMVPDDTKKGPQDLHPPFMTWREMVDDRYWFPIYVHGEGTLHFAPRNSRSSGSTVHIREVVKYTGYKRAPDSAIDQTPSTALRPRK
jgi:hypothetical protein